MRVQATSKIFSICGESVSGLRWGVGERIFGWREGLTRPMPWTSMDCFENCRVTSTRSFAISMGNLNVMEVSGDVEERKPLAMESCQTIVRSHC